MCTTAFLSAIPDFSSVFLIPSSGSVWGLGERTGLLPAAKACWIRWPHSLLHPSPCPRSWYPLDAIECWPLQLGMIILRVICIVIVLSISSEVRREARPSLQCRRPGYDSWVGEIPWRRKCQPSPVFLPGESHGQRSLAGYSPWGHKELGTTEWLTHNS